MDVAQSIFASSSSSPRPRSPPSVVTNLSNPITGVRVGRENRLRKVGQYRTMAAQFLETNDIEEAATLNKLADDLEQLDDPDDEAPLHQEPDVDECLGAFNKLAVVNLFDRGIFDGAEGLLPESDYLLPEAGSLNTIQGDQPTAYEKGLIDQLTRYKTAKAQQPQRFFDLNGSDGSDDESQAKHQRRFDLNASDESDDEPLESPGVGRLAMHVGSSSSIHPDDHFTTEEYQTWLRSLPPGALGRDMDPPTSDDFKAWRILYRQNVVPEPSDRPASDLTRRVARERRLRQHETALTRRDQDMSEQPDDEYMFDNESRASAPLSASGRASPRLDIPPGLYISDGTTILSSTPRFILVVTQSLINAGFAPVGQNGRVFEVSAIVHGSQVFRRYFSRLPHARRTSCSPSPAASSGDVS